MADNSHVKQTLADLMQEFINKIAEASRLLTTINLLEERIGAAKTVMPGLSSAAGTPNNDTQFSSTGAGSIALRPDQFLGDEPLDAAKKYLKQVGHAAHMNEITDAIQRGGAAIKGPEWRDKLEQSLLRSVTDIIKVQEKTFGLTVFYTDEQIKRLRGTRRQATPTAKKGKRGRPKKSAPNTSKALAPKPGLTSVPKDEAEEELDFKELTG